MVIADRHIIIMMYWSSLTASARKVLTNTIINMIQGVTPRESANVYSYNSTP